MDKVRFGVVGLGNMGGHHVNYLPTVDGAHLAAIADTSTGTLEKYAGRTDLRKFATWQELVASDEVDAVIVATPHYSHPAIAKAAFAHGKHVLCEKPVAVSVAAARDLNAAHAKCPELKFAVMFQTRTVPLYMKLRELVRAGELGEVTRITWLATSWFRTWTYYASSSWRATWAGEGGGVLLNQCPHNLDLLQWIPDMMPSRVTAVASLGKTHPIEVEDEVSAIMEYQNGAIGHFITTTGEAPGTDRLEICGDRGRLVAEEGKLRFHRTRQSVRMVREESRESFPAVETWDFDVPLPRSVDGHKVVTQNFIRAIQRGEPLIAPGEEGVRGLEIGNAILFAGLTRKSVDLPLDGEAYEAFLSDLAAKSTGKKKLTRRDDAITDVAASFKH